MSLARILAGTALTGTAAGVGVAGYAACEARAYTLRRFEVPALPPGAPTLRVLHLSDLHLMPGQTRKLAWLTGLRDLRPDLVVDTGDNISDADAVGPLLDALGPLLDLPGVFVHGSNDYFSPGLRNPLRYLLPDDGRRATGTPQLPWRALSRRFADAGWRDLTNARAVVDAAGLRLAFAGVDDPHLRYDDLDAVGGPAEPDADLRLGVAHAPYLRVLDRFAAGGYDGILAGHTHGGQVRLPRPASRGGSRALTTNCDLEPERARGLHEHTVDDRRLWLHVSAGLGTNPYVRLRLACRPEATLLTLVPVAGSIASTG